MPNKGDPFAVQSLILKNGGTLKTQGGTTIISVSDAGVVSITTDSQTIVDLTATGDVTLGNASSDTVNLGGGVVKYGLTAETRTGAGAVSVVVPITWIVSTGANALTLANGEEGQRKFIIMKTDGGTATLTPTNLGNGTTLTFDDVGDSADLLFTNGEWYFMGGTATLA
jgi:hypothetical protein